MKKLIMFLGGILIVLSIFLLGKNTGTKDYDIVKDKNDKLSMMLETDKGNYEEVTRDTWPTEGYKLNTTLSRCENGGTISWDDKKKIVIMNSDSSEKCYVYFDIYNDTTLATYIKSLYTGTQGENNLYLHDDTLENGANDGSYRYAGASDTTNNFVCFGYDSKDGTCPSDNLYRIIGVFGDNVKLIKWDYVNSNLLGTNGDYTGYWTKSQFTYYKGVLDIINAYHWNYNGLVDKTINNGAGSNVWSTSLLNKTNLNENLVNNIGTTWSNKIVDTTWKVGGNTYENIYNKTITIAYKNELTTPATNLIESAKIGLMYVSDYGYAAAPSAWTTNLSSYGNAIITAVNWMYMGLSECTIAPQTSTASSVFVVGSGGPVTFTSPAAEFAIRPSFYLESSVKYVSGNGTQSSPYIID